MYSKNPNKGVDYMGGSVHFDKNSKRYFIQIYWELDKHRFWRHPLTREPYWDKRSAVKQLNRIRTEIDEGYFSPKQWSPEKPLSINKYANEWLEIIEISNKTLKDYRSAVNNYITPFFGDKDIRHIRHSDIVQFHKWIKRSDKGKYNVVSTLRTMLRYAWRNEDIPKVPPFPKLSYALPEIEYLTLEQQDSILVNIPEPDRPIFQFMFEYGVRPGEARALKGDCVSDKEITIRRSFSDNELRETTKTNMIRVYEITRYFACVLGKLSCSQSLFVFVRNDGKAYTSKDLNRIWKKACKKAAIRIKLYNGVRHSLGCQLLDLGYDMDLVRQQLGHTKAQMTMRYAKRSNYKLSEALEHRRSNSLG